MNDAYIQDTLNKEMNGNLAEECEIHGESNVWNAAHRYKRSRGLLLGLSEQLIGWLWQAMCLGLVRHRRWRMFT